MDGSHSELETIGPEGDEPLPDEPLGGRLGRYELRQRLGRGAMGVVYRANDPHLGREVAVKVLLGRSTATDPERLLREANAMARVEHPNVVEVLDVGVEHGTVFVVMELLSGGSLADWLRTERSWQETVAMFVSIGRALAAIHAAGLTHRDFKPANVLLTDRGIAKVTDFGLAYGRLQSALAAELAADPTERGESLRSLSNSYSASSRVVGTPRYMAPEQQRVGPVDGRADQFAFCVALYEALYGQAPFSGDTVLERFANVAAGAVRTPPRRGVPRAIRGAVLRGLSVRARDRFEDMNALLAILESPKRAGRFGWLMAGVLAVGGAMAWEWPREPPAPVVPARAGAVNIAPFCDASWSPTPPPLLHPLEPVAVTAYARSWDALTRARAELVARYCSDDGEELSRSTLACLVDATHRVRGRFEALATAEATEQSRLEGALGSVPGPETCVEIAYDELEIDGSEARVAAEWELGRALGLVSLGRGDEAELVLSALSRRAELPLGFQARRGLAWGSLLKQRGASEEAADVFESSMRDAAAVHSWTHAALAGVEAMAVRGLRLLQIQRVRELQDEVGQHLERAAAPRWLRFSYLRILGASHDSAGDPQSALRYFEAALEVADSAQMRLHAQSEIGAALLATGRATEAAAILRSLLPTASEVAADSELEGIILLNLAYAEAQKYDWVSAMEHASAASVRFERWHGAASRYSARVDLVRGQAAGGIGDPTSAQRYLDRAAQAATEARDVVVGTEVTLAMARLDLERGDTEAAQQRLTRAAVELESEAGSDSGLLGVLRAELGLVEVALGRFDAARAHLAQAEDACRAGGSTVLRCGDRLTRLRQALPEPP